MQHSAADELDVEMTLAQRPLGGFAHDREDFGQRVIQGPGLLVGILDGADFLLPMRDAGAELVVGFGLQRRFHLADHPDQRPQALYFTVVLGAKDLPAQTAKRVQFHLQISVY